MLQGHRIAVVVPAYNEERLIERCLRSIPAWVDHIIVVDDASTDATVEHVAESADHRVLLARHESNRGVGAAIVTGYLAARDLGLDVAVVMAGDCQMHPDDMPGLLLPILRGEADYVKGSRMSWPDARRLVPTTRWLGIRALELLTRVSTGLNDLSDFQCGYTALRLTVLADLDPDSIYPRYGFPNDFLSRLAQVGARIAERPVRPVYGDERSDLHVPRVIVPILGILARAWWRRVRLTPPVPDLVSEAPPVERLAQRAAESA